MYNQTQVACFLRVAELASFSLAAKAMHLSPTAISKSIKKLEYKLGEQLLLRTTRSVQLTEFGAFFYKQCKDIEERILTLNQFIESSKEEPQGELKILVSTITSKAWILKHLSSFMKHYPLLRLELDFSEDDNALARSDIDIMVGYPVIPPLTEPLKYRKMYTVSNILCASTTFVAQYGLPSTASELPHFKIISHSLRRPAHSLPLADGGQLRCAEPLVYMNNFDALNKACLDGLGLFLTGDSLVKPWLESGELIQVLPQYQFKHFEIFMFYRAYEFEVTKIRAFLDFFSNLLVRSE